MDVPDEFGNEIISYSGLATDGGGAKIVPANVLPPARCRAGVLDAIEPEAVAFMSPRELWRSKLNSGDFIRIETRRGVVETKVRSDRDVPEGMVFMPFCYAEAAINLLTNPALDPSA